MGLANGEGSTFATNMRSCFSADTYDASNNQWPSTVGNYKGTFSGTAVTVEADAAGTFGVINQNQPYLKGTTNSKVAFGEIQGAGSFCAKTRYTGNTRKRIFDGEMPKNWLHGHWGGNAGVAHYEGWITGQTGVVSFNEWVTMCCQNAGPSCWVNGVKYTGNEVPGGVVSVTINQGRYSDLPTMRHNEEKSDWGAAFIASWENDLSDAQMEVVQHVMMSTYEYTDEPTFQPTQKPTLEPTFQPTQKPTHEPTFQPTEKPTLEPTFEPTKEPTTKPTSNPKLQLLVLDCFYCCCCCCCFYVFHCRYT